MGASHPLPWTCAPSDLKPDLVPDFAFSDMGCAAGALVGEDQGKRVVEYHSFFHVLRNQVSFSLLERTRIFSSLALSLKNL